MASLVQSCSAKLVFIAFVVLSSLALVHVQGTESEVEVVRLIRLKSTLRSFLVKLTAFQCVQQSQIFSSDGTINAAGPCSVLASGGSPGGTGTGTGGTNTGGTTGGGSTPGGSTPGGSTPGGGTTTDSGTSGNTGGAQTQLCSQCLPSLVSLLECFSTSSDCTDATVQSLSNTLQPAVQACQLSSTLPTSCSTGGPGTTPGGPGTTGTTGGTTSGGTGTTGTTGGGTSGGPSTTGTSGGGT